ncbi:hypothetical protein KJ885_05475, partial [Patescibacteria group bacterium]|nr:hypothetical protein [Patescibacteria group bacterium]
RALNSPLRTGTSEYFKYSPRGVRGDLIFIITAICAMSALLIHGLVDVPYFKNDLSILFWIIFSMPFIIYKK